MKQSVLKIKPVREVTNEEYAEYYEKYRACLHKSSRQWADRFGEDEALHVAGIALWRAMQSYDASRKANFLSYLINCLKWTFLDMNKAHRQHPDISEVATREDLFVMPPEIDDRPEVIKRHLNEKGCRVVDLVRAGKNPTEICAEIGVSRQRVHQIFGEIRNVHFKLSKTGKF